MALLRHRKVNYKIRRVHFFGFIFTVLKGMYNTCAINQKVEKQASVARILFAGFFGIFSTSINKIQLEAQIRKYNKKISTTRKA